MGSLFGIACDMRVPVSKRERNDLQVAGVQDIYIPCTRLLPVLPLVSFLSLADIMLCSWEIQMVLDKRLLMLSCSKYAWPHPVPVLRREYTMVTSDK